MKSAFPVFFVLRASCVGGPLDQSLAAKLAELRSDVYRYHNTVTQVNKDDPERGPKNNDEIADGDFL